MGVISRIFRFTSAKPFAPVAPPAAQVNRELQTQAGTGSARYDLEMVDLLEDEHQRLYGLHADTVHATDCEDFASADRLSLEEPHPYTLYQPR